MNDNAPAPERKTWSQPSIESLPIERTMAGQVLNGQGIASQAVAS